MSVDPNGTGPWPMIGPPNLEAQAEADSLYHRRGGSGVAFSKEGTLFEKDLGSVYIQAHALCLRKHLDYGPLNIAHAPGGPINGIRVRLHDKLARINHLVDSGAEPENESLRDSFVDMLNYAAIALMVLDGKWPDARASA